MKKVFVSGCYDILHAGHVQFFKDARKLGDHLTVCFASDDVLKTYKGRTPSIPEDNKEIVIGSLSCVDRVIKSSNLHPVFDFANHIKKERPDILAVTEDEKHIKEKREFCEKHGIKFAILPKKNNLTRVSTTQILQKISNRIKVPLRVDFAGGWLDVPRFSRKGGYIVNCSISPMVSDKSWPYEIGGGLGGSAARAILDIKNGVSSELKLGVGWQDPAIIEETGLCVWRSGAKPILDSKHNPEWLNGKMAILFTGKSHNTPNLANLKRDYGTIYQAGLLAKKAVEKSSLSMLAKAVGKSYSVQLKEGMDKLPDLNKFMAKKYLGGGHGGYALYIFKDKKDRDKALDHKDAKVIEPYIKK
ncbi:MAG: adenylyltransferase/cytidyltransferase family protein [Patescibacteria group bacterium]